MRALPFRSSLLAVACAGLCLAAAVSAEPVALTEALVLGPLPAGPEAVASPRVRASDAVVREVDPAGMLPLPDATVAVVPGQDATWRRLQAGGEGFVFADAGVYWLAARLTTDRFAEVTFTAPDGATLFVDGEEVSEPLDLPEGERFVFLRTVTTAGADTVALSAAAEAGLSWDLVPELSLADFDRARAVASSGDLAISPDGKLIARRISRRNAEGEGRRSEVAVLDGKGRLVAADLGGPDARPVAFSPDGQRLLLRRPGDDGTDLLLWTAPDGPMRTVVRDEPGLGLVRFSPDGRHLLLASRYALEPDEPKDERARRWDALRERVTDWDPLPHLHLLEIATGARRLLTRAGDWQLDDAVWLPDGASIVYGRTLPQAERPWFVTEMRRLDLVAGSDSLLTTFVAGWEVRPQAFAPHPDGKRIAFIGPPEPVGDGRPEHNVYNK